MQEGQLFGAPQLAARKPTERGERESWAQSGGRTLAESHPSPSLRLFHCNTQRTQAAVARCLGRALLAQSTRRTFCGRPFVEFELSFLSKLIQNLVFPHPKEQPKPSIETMIKTLRTYVGYATLLCFIISGLILNIAQLAVYALVRPFSQKLYREINHYLQYSYWSQSVAVTDWNTNVKCRIYYKDEESFKNFGSHSGVVIANHRYDIDWLAAWMLSDKLGTLGSDKAMLKASLRYIPVIGWGWSLCDMIFLSRNWQKDRENLANSMDILLTYPKSLILAFFEGTRFTQAKYEASLKFAEEKRLPIRLKHHLIPRTRGFNCMVQRIKGGMKKDPKLKYGLYNFQVALENDDNSKASLTSILGGTKTCIHIYVERLDIDDISIESEEATSNFLFKVYQEKDKLVDYFRQNGRFPGIEKPYKPRIKTLLNWSSWMLATYAALIYQYYICFISGSLFYLTILLTLALSAIFSVRMLVNSTKVSKSSSYGTTVPKTK